MNLLGKDWQTTVLGVISKAFLGFILVSQTNPEAIKAFFGKEWGDRIIAASILLWLILGVAKDRKTADATNEKANPVPDPAPRPAPRIPDVRVCDD